MQQAITSRKDDFAQWYVDVILNSKLADYGPVKGTMVIRPYGYALWERIQGELDRQFKATGHENAYFPLLIPQSFLAKEAEHVEGFSPQTAVVTIGGGEQLEEPLVIRPTSETIIWSMYKNWIQSHRDLPLLINQWVNVMRWEKRTRLFLRTNEFLWQEGHTAHATSAEAVAEAKRMIGIYQAFAHDHMALYVHSGRKSESERFAGAVDSYSIEALMQDGKALQAGTSHYLGQNFAKAFDVRFQNSAGAEELVWATSWGVSTRLIGALILSHSDDKGLVLPPLLAPIEIVGVPIYKSNNQTEVIGALGGIMQKLQDAGMRTKLDDDTNNSPGWKFSEWEMRGVPLRVECGQRDLDNDSVTLVRRVGDAAGEKRQQVRIDQVVGHCRKVLTEMQQEMFERSKSFVTDNTVRFTDKEECLSYLREGTGFAEVLWDGSGETEQMVKTETTATSRVIIEDVDGAGNTCIFSGRPAAHRALFAKSY